MYKNNFLLAQSFSDNLTESDFLDQLFPEFCLEFNDIALNNKKKIMKRVNTDL